MRIAVVHSYYSSNQPSGENRSVDAEVSALLRAGFDVQLFAAHTDTTEGDLFFPLRAAFRVASGRGRSPSDAIQRWKPDLVHVHNLFPNFGRRWTEDIEIPLVHTLRNYRPLCANGLLFRDGQACTLCPDGHRFSGLRFACYRDSRLATLPLSIATMRGPMRDPLIRRADLLIVLSALQMEVYHRAGVPPERLRLSPNFLPPDLDPGSEVGTPSSYFAAVGRLAPEKGFSRLAGVWPQELPLLIAGDGPARGDLEATLHPAIELLGIISQHDVMQLLRSAQAFVFPSLSYETFGRTAMEALACGTPVLATPGNAVASMIAAHGGGLVASWDALPEAVRELPVDRQARSEARHVFEAHFTEEAYARRIGSIYEDLTT
jgi:glycosyltransferase involved in cell wall biosynthesis